MNSTKEALERLQRCREEMSRLGLAGVIVPTADPHLSEYVPDDWKLRQALSGFTGSAGTLLVAEGAAALLADSRGACLISKATLSSSGPVSGQRSGAVRRS